MREISQREDHLPEVAWGEILQATLQHWKLVLGIGILLSLIGLVSTFSRPVLYTSTAQIVVRPIRAEDRQPEFAQIYRSLLTSDRVLQRTSQRLIEEDLVPDGYRVNEGLLSVRIDTGTDRRVSSSVAVITLTAREEAPQTATAMVNSWAASFIEESRAMLHGVTGGAQNILVTRLATVRTDLAELETEKVGLSNRFEKEEAEIRDRWDRKISNQMIADDKVRSDFHRETLEQMEEILEARMASISTEDPAEKALLREDLQEIVSLYWQWARTPRLLTLEKAPSDETLSDLLAAGRLGDASDSRLKTEEANPLYDFFAKGAIEQTLALRRDSAEHWGVIAPVISELEVLLVRRSASMVETRREQESKIRSLRRQQALDLSKLSRQRAEKHRVLGLKIEDLTQLEAQLRLQSTEAIVENLLEEADIVGLASPASVAHPTPRRPALAAGAGFFLGTILGFAIALLLSVRVVMRDRPVVQDT